MTKTQQVTRDTVICGTAAKTIIKGYVVWNYWDHLILLRTPSWQDADNSLKTARGAADPQNANWFGIEAVENIYATVNQEIKS